jgi:hypothetical protein
MGGDNRGRGRRCVGGWWLSIACAVGGSGLQFRYELTEGLPLCNELVQRPEVLLITGILLVSGTAQVHVQIFKLDRAALTVTWSLLLHLYLVLATSSLLVGVT